MNNVVLSTRNIDDLISDIANEVVSRIVNCDISNSQQKSKSEKNDLIVRKEALELLNISSSTLWLYEKEGKIQGYGVKGKRYYKRSEILKSIIEKK